MPSHSREARDLDFCLKVPLDSLLIWASSEGSGETAWMRRLTWTFAARISDKYQIRLTRSKCYMLKLSKTTYFFNWLWSSFCYLWYKLLDLIFKLCILLKSVVNIVMTTIYTTDKKYWKIISIWRRESLWYQKQAFGSFQCPFWLKILQETKSEVY